MCLIVVGWRVRPAYPLVVAANRDEFYARPSSDAGRWQDAPHIIGGRDLEAGGTWLGITDGGRFAAITNVREGVGKSGGRSRGALPHDFLTGTLSAAEFAHQIDLGAYPGFNLLLGDAETLIYCSNRDGPPKILSPGVYGLSNHVLDTPWPKLVKARSAFSAALDQLPDETAFFELMQDRETVPDHLLPATGVPMEWERLLSTAFVASDSYGTRASTFIAQHADRSIRFHEQRFGPKGCRLQSSMISTGV